MKPMSAPLRKLALVFAGAGLVVSLLAAYTHYRMLADVGYVSFCDVSATVSCTQVYSSRFGTFAGIPVAVFGAIWFALATLLAIAGFVARRGRPRKRSRISLRGIDDRARGRAIPRLCVASFFSDSCVWCA